MPAWELFWLNPEFSLREAIPEKDPKHMAEVFDVEIWQDRAQPPGKILANKIRKVDGLVSMLSDKIDREILDAAPRLKIIAQLAGDFDNIDVDQATKPGIYVTNNPGASRRQWQILHGRF